ncbi:Pleckstrin y domain-containing protein 1 [Glycine max]|nr:Pleckstrin y domain-containing protein 1 [Glycine max]
MEPSYGSTPSALTGSPSRASTSRPSPPLASFFGSRNPPSCAHLVHTASSPLPRVSIKGTEDILNKPNAFELSTRSDTMYFIVDSEKEKEDWVNSIGRSIVQHSRF